MFKTQKINNAIVTPLQLKNQFRPDQIYGYEFCSQPYATWLLCAKSRQGKGTAMYHILNHTIDPLMKTNVVIFSSTIHRDPLWEKTISLLERKKCNVSCYSHFLTEGRKKDNILTELINTMDENDDKDDKQESDEEEDEVPFGSSKKIKEKKNKKPTKISSKWLFIFDDLPMQDMRNDCFNFVMRNRHYKCKVILSVQYLNMLLPSVRKNLTNVILFKSFSDEKLHSIYNDLDIEIPFDQFVDLYHFATEKQYSFLQYDVHNGVWIKNFNEKIIISL